MRNEAEKRERFSSGLGVFFATLGSAVGLGNIWKFPYLAGLFGGGAFLLVYLLCVVFIGLPIMISEFYAGRKTRRNAVGAFEQLKPGAGWKVIGLMGVVSAYLIMFFYSSVAGWVYSYVYKILRGRLTSASPESLRQLFDSTSSSAYSPILWQLVVLAAVAAILILGVKNGIERVTKTLMPVLFILIILCDIRAVTLPGAAQGFGFLFDIDFSKLTALGVLTALGLAFFKLSLGMGTMTTYASYFTSDNNLAATSVRVALSDTVVSMLAGVAIFPAVFSFGMQPGSGPGLLFVTLPLVFMQMPFGSVLLLAFFVLTSIAATTAMISMVEVPTAYLSEEKGIPRKPAVLINTLIIAVAGSLASLSGGNASPLSGMRIFGKTFFDLFDFTSSNLLLPLGGLLIALFAGYAVTRDQLADELSNNGKLNTGILPGLLSFLLRYITPVLLLVVFLYSTGLLKAG